MIIINELRVAVIGGGVIGSGWAARFSENGAAVSVYDPAPNAQQKLDVVLENAEHAYSKLTMAPRANKGAVRLVGAIDEAVRDAELIIEAVPEDLALKKSVYADIEKFASQRAIIASSTSGILPSDLQSEMTHPERLLVGHPFNPVYLLPMVELVGGKDTDAAVIKRASEIYSGLGMRPLHLKKEIEAFVADRLMEAVWRESLWLVKDGIATTEELDDAIRFGFGLRWAQMGLFETFRLAGGDAGMRHFMAQFGPCLQWPWTKHIDENKVINAINVDKDVDGFHIENVGKLSVGEESLVPCTPTGCVMLLKEQFGDLTGKNAVIVGRSNIVGKPVAMLLLKEHCTVTIAHSRTRDLPAVCRQADILVAAVGVPQLIKGDWIKPGAVVIDVGINRIETEEGKTRLVGDVDFADASNTAGAITPVPGGVGPMTIACLLRSTVIAACRQNGVAIPECL